MNNMIKPLGKGLFDDMFTQQMNAMQKKIYESVMVPKFEDEEYMNKRPIYRPQLQILAGRGVGKIQAATYVNLYEDLVDMDARMTGERSRKINNPKVEDWYAID